MPLIATVGASDANSYLTVDGAAAILAAHPHSTPWDEATSETREKALQYATRLLDQLVEWPGSRATESQALEWPRQEVLHHRTGEELPEDEIPVWLQNATAEYAMWLLKNNPDEGKDGVSSFSFGALSVNLSRADDRDAIPAQVRRFLRNYVTMSPTARRLVRT